MAAAVMEMAKRLEVLAVKNLVKIREPGEAAKETIKLGYVQWACAEASTHVAQAVIMDKLGYECTTTSWRWADCIQVLPKAILMPKLQPGCR